jgi:hypothetical protein
MTRDPHDTGLEFQSLERDVEARDCFLYTLDWLLALHCRYARSLQFGLIHIAFCDPQQPGGQLDEHEAALLLVDLTQALQNACRRTDLVARDGVDFWILVPFSEPEHVADKVRAIVDAASATGLDLRERHIAVHYLPQETLADKAEAMQSASALLAYLKRIHPLPATRQ